VIWTSLLHQINVSVVTGKKAKGTGEITVDKNFNQKIKINSKWYLLNVHQHDVYHPSLF